MVKKKTLKNQKRALKIGKNTGKFRGVSRSIVAASRGSLTLRQYLSDAAYGRWRNAESGQEFRVTPGSRIAATRGICFLLLSCTVFTCKTVQVLNRAPIYKNL